MLNDIYNKRIIELAGNIPRLGRLPDPDASATAHSKLCGSTVTVDLAVGPDGVVTDFAHDVKACALGQASAAVLGAHVIGAGLDEISTARDQLAAMLKFGGPAPSGRFEDLAVLAPVKDYPARHASTLLAFEAAVAAVRQARQNMASTRTSGADAA